MSNFFNDAVKSGYFMYMAEAEGLDGLVDTRTAKLNAVANELRYDPSKCTYEGFAATCVRHGLDILSDNEVEYIKNKISK